MNTASTEYETVIGLEVHVQLKTKTKMFCNCRADYQYAPPNTLVCPVCLGMPGVLPVVNRKAVEQTIASGLALNCEISVNTKFDRKNYPYPDLMKGFQISQYDMPIAKNGHLDIELSGNKRSIGIERVHLEEDVAKLQHVNEDGKESYSLVDVNRSGVALMEIVGDPDIRSPEEARQYLISLRSILQCIEVTTGNMEEGSLRCDANISVRPKGTKEYTTRTEIKNMNSFRSVYNALVYEIKRQIDVVETGDRVVQETRGWVEERGVTVSQRSKEQAHDYRYFPEPDLPPMKIDRKWVEEISRELPELPIKKRDRFVSQYNLSRYDAELLTMSKGMANFFEDAIVVTPKTCGDYVQRSKSVANWLLGDLTSLLHQDSITIEDSKIRPSHIGELLDMLEEGILTTPLAKKVLAHSFANSISPLQLVQDGGYELIGDTSVLLKAVKEVIISNPKAVSDYKLGKQTAAKFLVGQVMRNTKGKADPVEVSALVEEELKAI